MGQVEREKIIAEIESITQEDGFIYTLCLMRINNIIPIDDVADFNPHTKLSGTEEALLIALFLKHNLKFLPTTGEKSLDQMERLKKLFHELHIDYNKPFFDWMKTLKSEDDISAKKNELILNDKDLTVESIFYAEQGAFDIQMSELAVKRYKKDEAWILSNKGFSLETANKFYDKALTSMTEKLQSLDGHTDFDTLCDAVLEVFCVYKKDFNDLPMIEVANILSEFSVQPGTFDANKSFLPGEYNEFHSRPIVQLDSDRFFIPLHHYFALSCYESPYYWMLTDDDYVDKASENRGDATVDLAYDFLCKVFGEDKVFKEVLIEEGQNHISDIDLLVTVGNRAIVLQCKSKKLTLAARGGDVTVLKKDFQGAVQHAFDQGKTCRVSILKNQGVFTDKNGNQIKLDDKLADVYIICVTAEQYPAVLHQVSIYLEKDESDHYPLTVSLFDLELLTFYLNTPFDFLYYLRQRINHYDLFKSSSEMDLLAYHLNQKIIPRKDEKSGKYLDLVGVDGMGQLIYANYPVARGWWPETEGSEKLRNKWQNPEFQKIIDELSNSNEPGFTEAIFFLYDLKGDSADAAINAIDQVKRNCKIKQKSFSTIMSFQENKAIICYVCDYGSDAQLERHLLEYCEVKKYQLKASLCIGLGGMAEDIEKTRMCIFKKSPWKHDPTLELISRNTYVGGTHLVGNKKKKLGRNDKCFCGSDLKFKKCHGK